MRVVAVFAFGSLLAIGAFFAGRSSVPANTPQLATDTRKEVDAFERATALLAHQNAVLGSQLDALRSPAGPPATVAPTSEADKRIALPAPPVREVESDPQAVVKGHQVLAAAKSNGRWTQGQAVELRSVSARLSQTDLDALMRELAVVINNDEIKPEANSL